MRYLCLVVVALTTGACASTGEPAPAHGPNDAPGEIAAAASTSQEATWPDDATGTEITAGHPLHAVCAAAYEALDVDAEGFHCQELQRVGGGAAPISSAALLSLSVFDMGSVHVRLLAFHDGAAWTRGPVVQDLSIPGIGGHNASGAIEGLSLQTAGDAPLLSVEGYTKRADSDLGYNALTIDDQREVWFCTADEGAPTCAMVPLEIRREVTTIDPDGERPPPDYELGLRAWERTYEILPDGTITLRPGDGDLVGGFTVLPPADYAPVELVGAQQDARVWRAE